MTTWPKHCPSRNRLNMCTCQLLKRQVNKKVLPVWLSSILRAALELLGDASGLISLVLVFNPPWSVSTSRFGIVKWRLGAGLSLLSPAVFGLDSLLWTIWEKSASITKTTSLQQLPLPIFSWWHIAMKTWPASSHHSSHSAHGSDCLTTPRYWISLSLFLSLSSPLSFSFSLSPLPTATC